MAAASSKLAAASSKLAVAPSRLAAAPSRLAVGIGTMAGTFTLVEQQQATRQPVGSLEAGGRLAFRLGSIRLFPSIYRPARTPRIYPGTPKGRTQSSTPQRSNPSPSSHEERTGRTLAPRTPPQLAGKERTRLSTRLGWGLAKFKPQEPAPQEPTP